MSKDVFSVWYEFGGSVGRKLAYLKVFMSEIIIPMNSFITVCANHFRVSSYIYIYIYLFNPYNNYMT